VNEYEELIDRKILTGKGKVLGENCVTLSTIYLKTSVPGIEPMPGLHLLVMYKIHGASPPCHIYLCVLKYKDR